jgi:hypothetical protein
MEGREDQMSGERRLNGNLRRLEIARLANHNAVGVLAQECRNTRAKVKPIASFTGT